MNNPRRRFRTALNEANRTPLVASVVARYILNSDQFHITVLVDRMSEVMHGGLDRASANFSLGVDLPAAFAQILFFYNHLLRLTWF
jgi:hypothetical protein